MTMIAPGAFVWFLLPIQLSLAGARGIWAGVLLALAAAFLTAAAFSTLARRFPEAGFYSAYHFAQQVFREQGGGAALPLKFVTGWAAHLFYWIYPGVMVAFLTTLIDYLLRQFGSQPTVFGKLILAAAIAGFIGFLALRGISGSMTASILLNVLQISVLLIFSAAAIAFRLINPLSLGEAGWLYPQPAEIFLPAGGAQGILVQAAAAIFLVLGFESVVSLGVAAVNPRRDLPRGTILALLLQGLLAYSLQYFAFSFALTPEGLTAVPLGDLALRIGDRLLAGNGFTLMLVAAASVLLAGLAAALTALNTGVRTTFAMMMDPDMPEYLGLLRGRSATPYTAVVILSIVSAVIGLAGALGGSGVLAGLMLAVNLGAFILYAVVCGMSLAASPGWRGRVLGLAGLLVNLGLGAVIVFSALDAGATGAAARLALILSAAWLLLSGGYYALRRGRAD
jgi:amino acid transporter